MADQSPTYVPPVYPPPADPRAAPPGSPIALPQVGTRYPQEGIPYPDPDRDPLLDPTVTSLNPATAVVGAPNFTVHVIGTQFDPLAVILWNGSPEPTTRVSATELTTEVNMASVTGAYTVQVGVLSGAGVMSNTLPFAFTTVEEEPTP